VYNVRLIIEYHGAEFHGWQFQPGLRTVQGELHRVLEVVVRQKIGALHAAGRTDSGVHARGQVVTFRVPEAPEMRRLKYSVSSLFRGDLAVRSADLVPYHFHPRRSAVSRQYSYRIVNRDSPLVLDLGRAWHIIQRLDVAAMSRAAAMLEGEHDFSSFRGAGCTVKNPVKRIFESGCHVTGEDLHYRIRGTGFLRHMVRNIVGSLVAIGRGQHPPEWILDLMARRDRRAGARMAPAQGLYLDEVEYPPEALVVTGGEAGGTSLQAE